MKSKKGFTLIELLVVIAIIALLLSIIAPALKKARGHARTVMCASNLKQFSVGFEMYQMTHNYKRFVIRDLQQSGDTVTYWMGRLAPYMGDESYGKQWKLGEVIDVLMCPSAPAANQTREVVAGGGTGFWGSWNRPWEWTRSADMTTLSGYGINGWIVHDEFYRDWSKLPEAYQDWLRTPANVPIFGDCVWPISWVWDADKGRIPSMAELRDPGEATFNSGFPPPGVWKWAMDRHNKGINMVLKDGSVAPVKMNYIFDVPWSKVFKRDSQEVIYK
ncbi:MAG: prepilin-type N-terminal cleavage/methylation domain-containing protein [Sedimentisphaerales bacterium]|nr:prepilin-type N-terminal cleavage/methylation domain-containing protein [Sedimentisphaerales bacterium]